MDISNTRLVELSRQVGENGRGKRNLETWVYEVHTLYGEYFRTRMEMSSSIANSFPSQPLSWSKIEFSLVFDVSKNPGYPFLGVILYSVFWAEYYCGFAPMPCHAYADTIPILSPGEDRKHPDWCHAVSPSTCLGTWQKYILSNMKHAHFIHYKVQDCSQSQTQYPKFQPCSS